MSTPAHNNTADVDAVRAVCAAQTAALVAGDAEALAELLDEGFTAGHIGGGSQTAADWVADVRSGRMQYHRVSDTRIGVKVASNTAVAVVSSRVDATIWGARSVWPLISTLQLIRRPDGWKITRADVRLQRE